MPYDPNIHHRKSIRLKGYDYSQAGMYFITLCVQDKLCLFGEVVNGEMVLNDAGRVAKACWLNIPEHFPNAILHEHIVMPNHVHGIIEFVGANHYSPEPCSPANDSPEPRSPANDSPEPCSPANDSPEPCSPANDSPEPCAPNNNFYNNHFTNNPSSNNDLPEKRANNDSPLRSPSKTIGSVVRGYKIGVVKWVRLNGNLGNIWQRNYYEHIIRNEQSYYRISEYILNNPKNWDKDTFYNQ